MNVFAVVASAGYDCQWKIAVQRVGPGTDFSVSTSTADFVGCVILHLALTPEEANKALEATHGLEEEIGFAEGSVVAGIIKKIQDRLAAA